MVFGVAVMLTVQKPMMIVAGIRILLLNKWQTVAASHLSSWTLTTATSTGSRVYEWIGLVMDQIFIVALKLIYIFKYYILNVMSIEFNPQIFQSFYCYWNNAPI